MAFTSLNNYLSMTMGLLLEIPGVGPSIEKDLIGIGIKSVDDLKGKNPEELYKKIVKKDGPTDKCVLYVLSCGVYYASYKKHKPEYLK